MARFDYYETLGVTRSVTDADIKKAYRKLVLQHHPDRNPNSKEAEAKIRQINAAYEILGDPEKRGTYERLRWGDEPRDIPPDPSAILDAMEQKLFEEGHKEIFQFIVKDVKRAKAELAMIRERAVAAQGYDTFKDDIVRQRAAEVMHDLVAPDREVRKKNMLDVALEMMISQKVARRDADREVKQLRDRLTEIYQRGRQSGYASGLELFYERR